MYHTLLRLLMFKRLSKTYDLNPSIVDEILKDDANPLNRIYQLIPDGSKVLDIGAGNGLLALILQRGRNIIIDGIEPDPYGATLAKKFYRNFYCGLAQKFKKQILKEEYDFIVLADVIEHMQDPLTFLQELTTELPNKTKIILSVPNVAFGAVRVSLLNGNFDYVDSGLLERSHIRFFTLKTMLELVSKIGINIEKLFFLQRDIFNCEIPLKMHHVNPITLWRILSDEYSSVYQFLFVLSKKSVNTENKFYGQKTKFSIIQYILN